MQAGLGKPWRFARRRLALSAGISASVALAALVGCAGWSAVQPLLYPRLPYRDAGRIVTLWEVAPQSPSARLPISPPDFHDWSGEDIWSGLAAFGTLPMDWAPSGAPTRHLSAVLVSPQIWAVLGIHPSIGRPFGREDYHAQRPRTVLISDRLWRQEFGRDPNVLGRVLPLRGALNDPLPCRVLGVIPPGVNFPFPAMAPIPDLWLPLPDWNLDPTIPRSLHTLWVVGRLRAGVPIAAAQARTKAVLARTRGRDPADAGIRLEMRRLGEADFAGSRRLASSAAFGLALLILAVSANLLILGWAGLASRRQEFATRAALGAPPARLRLLAFSQFVLLCLPALALGIWLAHRVLRPIAEWVATAGVTFGAPPTVSMAAEVISVLVILALGTITVLPAPPGPEELMRASSTRRGGGISPIRSVLALLPLQSAMAALAVALAALLLGSLARVTSLPVGARPARVLVAAVMPPPNPSRSPAAARAFDVAIEGRLSAMPGVEAIGGALEFPAASRLWHFELSSPDGARRAVLDSVDWVTPGFFSVLPLPILAGRPFTSEDRMASPPVAIVSASLAKLYWGGRSPIGSRLTLAAFPHHELTVIGVAADYQLAGARPLAIYLCFSQQPYFGMKYLIRSSLPPAAVANILRTIAAAAIPGSELRDVATLAELRSAWLARPRAAALALSAFAIAALLIALEASWVLSYWIASSKAREAAIRAALGARQRTLALSLARDVLGLGLTGVGTIAISAPALAPLLGHFLGGSLGFSQWLAACAATICVVGLGAYVPALRVAHRPPARLLCGE